MDISFNYVSTFVSLIYGLALTHALTCIAEYIQNLNKIKNYWVWWIWALFLLLLSNGFWISIYYIWNKIEEWEMIYVVFISFEACIFYLMYYFFFNHIRELENNDLKKEYYKNSRYFFGLLALAMLCMINLSEVIIGKYSIIESFKKYTPGMPIFALLLTFTKNHWIHAIFGVICTLLFLLNIFFKVT